MTARRTLIAASMAAVAAISACSGNGDDPSVTSPEAVATVSTSTSLPARPPTTASATSTTVTTPSTTPSTTTSTTVPVPPEVVAAACASLADPSLDVVLASLVDWRNGGTSDEPLTAACPDLANRADRILAEFAWAQTNTVNPNRFVSDLTCEATSIQFTIVNSTDVSRGFFAVATTVPQVSGQRTVAAEPIAVASLAPGASARVVADLPADIDAASYSGDQCSVEIDTFLVPVSASSGVDAPVVADDPQRSDDVHAWIPTLLSTEQQPFLSLDALVDIEDVHSGGFWLLVSESDLDPLNRDPQRPFEPRAAQSVPAYAACAVFPTDDPTVVAVGYQRTVDSDVSIAWGMFRRGLDGVWRWLGQAIEVEGVSCDTWPGLADVTPGQP